MNDYKSKFSLEQRKQQSQLIFEKHPRKIPLVVTHKKETLENNKYLVPKDYTVAQFMYQLTQKCKLNATQSHIVFINGNFLPRATDTFISLYTQHKDSDGFLYLVLTTENTFGA